VQLEQQEQQVRQQLERQVQQERHRQQVQQQVLVQLQELGHLFYHMQPRQQLKELPIVESLSCQLSFEGKVGLTISRNCHKI
jgi:hypothetical protein